MLYVVAGVRLNRILCAVWITNLFKWNESRHYDFKVFSYIVSLMQRFLNFLPGGVLFWFVVVVCNEYHKAIAICIKNEHYTIQDVSHRGLHRAIFPVVMDIIKFCFK